MKQLLIIQPGKFGDIIICLPIAKWYSEQEYKVYWQCPLEYHDLFRNIDYCTPIVDPALTGKFSDIIDLSFGLGGAPEQWWQENKSKYDSFVTAKYDLAQVPVTERWNLQWNRNIDREEDLAYSLGCYDEQVQNDVCLVHSQGSFGSRIPLMDMGFRLQIEFHKKGDYNIFDWYNVIEKSNTIVCVDSSLANFIEVVPQFKHKTKYLYDIREQYQWLKSIYRNGWTVKS